MAPKLPYSRVTNVSMTRNDNFPTRRGFGTQLILTHSSVVGQVDATKRTKLYATLAEVEADFGPATSVYKAALAAFSQNPRPVRLKVGYAATPVGADDAAKKASFIDSLSAIVDYDQSFYQITLDAALRDQPYLDGLVEWVEAQPKIAMLDTNDIGHENPANTTSISARHKGTVERTATFYHTSSSEYLAASMAAYMSTRVFDDADTAYTLKFKKAPGITPIDRGSAAVTSITGFVEQTGQSESAGHCSNTYIDIGDQDFLVEGSTLTQNVFIDEIHATDWIIARTEEEMLGLYLNNARIPYTDQGMQQLASVPRMIMNLATRAGLVARDLNPVTGRYEAAVQISVPSVFDVPESQRKARIAPAITVRFRYAGAIHYSTINYFMSF